MTPNRPIRWIDEQTAAELIGFKPYTLRRYVKSGRLKVIYTHVNMRRYKYNRLDIEKMLMENSNA